MIFRSMKNNSIKPYIKWIIRWLQADAKIIETTNSEVNISEIVDTKLFDYDKATMSPLWIKELESWWHHTHVSETDEYWITSFVYKRDKPFHPERFLEIVNKTWPWVVRSKWLVWIASRNDYAWNWSLAGWSIKLDAMWRWMASFSREERIAYDHVQNMEYEKEYVWKRFWDRTNEFVVIWVKMNNQEIEKLLDYALLTDEEMNKPEKWSEFEDNLPKWFI